jgi:pimeloyl-ACP methyl ester carboxylesterase
LTGQGAVYLLPGRGDPLDGTLGRIIAGLGFSVQGRAITSDFLALWFGEQLALVETDLRPAFDSGETALVGQSYGAYVLLHTLAALPRFPGRVLLISPVLGAGTSADGRRGSLPPRAGRLLNLARQGRFPCPGRLDIHAGARDRGCDPSLAQEFASRIPPARLHIVPGEGHTLPHEYLEHALRAFLVPGPDMMAGQ